MISYNLTITDIIRALEKMVVDIIIAACNIVSHPPLSLRFIVINYKKDPLRGVMIYEFKIL